MSVDNINARLAKSVTDAIETAKEELKSLGFEIGACIGSKYVDITPGAENVFVIDGYSFRSRTRRPVSANLTLDGRAYVFGGPQPTRVQALGSPNGYKVLATKEELKSFDYMVEKYGLVKVPKVAGGETTNDW